MTGLTGNNILAGSSGQGGYEIEQSLRFEDGDSAYLSRTPSSAGNRKTWTWSGWVKLGAIGTQSIPISAYQDGSNFTRVLFAAGNVGAIKVQNTVSNVSQGDVQTDALFRDPSAWYHVIILCDTTQGTASSRLKIYVNGAEQTLTTNTSFSLNSDTFINNTTAHYLGAQFSGNSHYDGYIAEVNFVDGQALDPSNFGETDLLTNQWIPKKYVGTYGTNGFYLNFSDSASLGTDSSGNGNDFTPTNLAATDQVLDSPTNNFATLNPLGISDYNKWTFSEGNLKAYNASNAFGEATFYLNSGKWYFEVDHTNNGGKNGFIVALVGLNDNYVAGSFDVRILDSVAVGLYGVSIDMDTGGWSTTLNGSALSSGSFTSQECKIAFLNGNSANSKDFVVNFGQDSSFAGARTAQGNTDDNGVGDFYYVPPSGYLALCEDNLPDPSIALPGDHFNTVLYSGDGSASNSITGVGFQPDLSWIKTRNDTQWHMLNDVVRGVNKSINSNATNAEFTDTDRFLSFDVDGFTVGADGSVNGSGDTLVSWNWKADNTSGSSNTDGTITSTVSANTTAGFSIVKYTGTGSNETVGHGLSQAPDCIINKRLTGSYHWLIWHTAFNDPDKALLFNSDAVADNRFGPSYPTSTVFGAYAGQGSISSVPVISYCFHSVEGYSKFGSYTGNGSNDGPFIYTGFSPAFLIVKEINTSSQNWYMMDNKRGTNNPVNQYLHPNQPSSENGYAQGDVFSIVDFVSNGFKIKHSRPALNQSGNTLIYMAFAESPFKYSNAR